jgi:trigger factor
MSLAVQVTPVENHKHKVTLRVEVPAEQATQEYNKACRRVGQRVNVPGFRRGKAPVRLVEKSVGVDRIKEEALERFLPFLFADVVGQQQLDVVAPPRIQDLSFDLGQPMTVVAEVDLRPEVSLPSFPLTVEVEKSDESPNAVEEEITRRLKAITRPVAVEGRTTVEATDILTLDFDGSLNGEPIDGGQAKEFVLDLNNNHFIEGFTEQMPGKTLGETFTMDVTFPEDYFDETLAGKATQFTVTIHKIEVHATPELNADALPLLGNYDSVDDFKADVQTQIEERQVALVNMRKEHATVQTLLKGVDLELHDSMIEQEVGIMAEDFMNRLRQQGMSPEAFVEQMGRENLLNNFRVEAQERLKTSLSFASIAKEQGFQVTDAEFAAEVKKVAEGNNVDEKVVMRNLSRNPRAVQGLTDQLLGQKVLEWLLANSTFVEVEKAAEAPAIAEVNEASAVESV